MNKIYTENAVDNNWNQPKLLVINGEPIKEEHISWYTARSFSGTSEIISLYEVVRADYEHPEAPGYTTISQIEIRLRNSCKIISEKAAPLLLLEAALKTVSLLNK